MKKLADVEEKLSETKTQLTSVEESKSWLQRRLTETEVRQPPTNGAPSYGSHELDASLNHS